MSDSATSPAKAPAVADESAARPADAPVGEVSGAKIEVTDAEGVPAPESKEEASVTDVKKEDDTAAAAAAAKSDAPADDVKSEPEADKKQDDVEAPKSDETAQGPATPAVNKNARRKSSGTGGTAKKLNKKQSKASMAHLDAKPGDYYYIKMKGYPKWPGIVASEDMLPEIITSKRPVSAARPDGSYRDDFQDGGKRVLDRTFPCMFLGTNEFCWAVNTDLEDLDVTTVGSVKHSKMSKALVEAHTLAAENHDLQYFKDLLDEHAVAQQQELEELAAKEEARVAAQAAKEAAKEAAKTPKKGKKAKSDGDDEDVEMGDADEEAKPKSSKKRKADADEAATPKGTDSVKKPKLKLTHTPKANGTATPKAAKEKKAAKPKKKANGAAAEPEPEEDPEAKRQKKEKEILYFRHKLQKGLLTRDQAPKEEEMPAMAEYITKLEGYADLEVSIIRQTKINKVLKAILKLEAIPREEEFKFKTRSTELLGKWNKILESETPGAAVAQANGTSNGDAKPEAEKAVKAAEPEKADVEMAEASNSEAKVEEPAAKADDAAEPEAPVADADVAMQDADDKGEEKLEVEEPKTDATDSKDEAESSKVDTSA